MSMIGGFYIWSLIDFFKGLKNDKQARTCPICNHGFSSFKEMWIHKQKVHSRKQSKEVA
jgi:hypothetical protein